MFITSEILFVGLEIKVKRLCINLNIIKSKLYNCSNSLFELFT